MKKIIKGKEPNSLTEHRSKKHAHATYANYNKKDDLRVALVRDQRGICCYCMTSITPISASMKIEHWQCQEKFPAKELIFSNLLGACLGNTGQPKKLQHCDTFKGNEVLSKNPSHTLYDIEETIQYPGNGQIKSTDKVFDKELNSVLNLNVAKLVNERKAVLTAFTDSLTLKGNLKKADIRKMITTWNGDDRKSTDTLRPYCQVVVYWLRKRLNR